MSRMSLTATAARIVGMTILVLVSSVLRAEVHNGAVRLGDVVLASREGESGDASVLEVKQAETPPRIDGDTGEWPEAQWHRFAPGVSNVSNQLQDDGPTEPPGTAGTAADLTGSFALQWDDDWLYLAARVTDNVHDVSGWFWYSKDSISLFLDIPMDGDGLPWISGDHTFSFVADPTYPADGKWWRHGDNTQQPVQQEGPAPPGTRMAVRLGEGGNYTLEAAIPISDLTKLTPAFHAPFAGRMVGFMFLATDPDDGPNAFGGQLTYGGNNDNDANWMRLRFRPSGAGLLQMGRIEGKVKWEDKAEGLAYGKVRIQSLTSADYWAQVETDSQGVYTAEVPVGKYRVGAGYRHQSTAGVEVEVKARETAAVAEVPFARPPLGLTVPAGPGTRVVCPPPRVNPAGPGFRRQAFRTYTPVDGLPGTFVLSLYQDRAGGLWIGTQGGGVTRFDGATFATLTQEDGLPGSYVRAIVQDHQDALWFSAWRPGMPGTDGLCRFDGTSITRFDMPDGLPTTAVYGMDVDAAGAIWLATPKGAVRYDGRSFTTFTREDGLASDGLLSVRVDSRGRVWLGSESGSVSRFDAQGFTSYGPSDGLTSGPVVQMREDREGNIWFLDRTVGATCYDGNRFITYGRTQGLPEPIDMAQAADGRIWFTTNGNNVYRMEGTRFIRVGADAGLPHAYANTVLAGRGGTLWFGTAAGLSQYLGDQFQVFTAADFAGTREVYGIAEDRDHRLWLATDLGLTRYDGSTFATFTPARWRSTSHFGTTPCPVLVSREGSIWMGTSFGLFQFDGRDFTTYTTEDGLAGNYVIAIAQDAGGALWVASWDQGLARQRGARFEVVNTGLPVPPRHVRTLLPDRAGGMWIGSFRETPGLYHYDGTQYVSHTSSLPWAPQVTAIAADTTGALWIGTWDSGVGRYDGREFTDRGVQGGVISNWVSSLLVDRQGHWWAGTLGGGVNISDGTVFQSLTIRDGLPDDNVQALFQDHSGAIWIATEGGLCRYRPQSHAPEVMVADVITDRPLGPVAEVTLTSSQKYLRVEYRAQGQAAPGRTVYLYRLAGRDAEWRSTREERVEYGGLPVGKYELQLRAVDQDLNYSEICTLGIEVAFPYAEVGRWAGTATACLVATAALVYGTRRRREQRRAEQALMREMAEELQTAHEMQMALMPKAPPQIQGFEITGRCLPANHVGGDLFQYFHQNHRLSVCLADVTGHAMEAAIPVVMFSGVLDAQMEMGGSVEELFARLNRSLHRTLTGRTFVCFALGELELSTHVLRLSNSGCPYPYHYRAAAGEVAELQVDAYPLGVRPDTTYQTIEVQLEHGDRVVFCSDGIIEAANGAGEMFGFERTGGAIRRGCAEDLSAEDLLARIVAEVTTFRGDTPQGDDQTVVVLKVDDRRDA